MQPRIKKSRDGNQYLLTPEGVWVRDFTKTNVVSIDLNDTIQRSDHFLFLENETKNKMLRMPWVDSEKFFFPKVVIVNDGYDFERRQSLLENLPKDWTIFAVNGALQKWSVKSRSINWYVVNNPYADCLKFLPRRRMNLPKCIASSRTNHKFLAAYETNKYRYYPVNETSYASLGVKEVSWQVDDYRNPICASINLAYRFGAESIFLFCCDDSFDAERPGSVSLENGLHTYPQHIKLGGIVDGMFHWLKNHPHYDFHLYDFSSSKKYSNAEYIQGKDFPSFFNKVGEKNE
jgi:hypothetical protein